jgi:FkbM family methyltransferase
VLSVSGFRADGIKKSGITQKTRYNWDA